jgi:hypothetical protein
LDGKESSGASAKALSDAKTYTNTKISELINGAPTTLDTLGEIATAMKTNSDVVDALNNAIGTKANASDLTAHTGNKENPHGVTAVQSGALPITGGTLSGTLDFSSNTAWITPYLLAFKNDDPNSNPTYPYTGFYQWGDEWQVNARDNTNTFVHSVLSINLVSKVANFSATPTVNGSPLALTSQIPTDYAKSSHTHSIDNVTNLQAALDGKAPSSHTHSIANITNLQTTLDSKAPIVHNHDYIQNGTVGIKVSDSNEVSFSSNSNFVYFGYDNRAGSSVAVDTYRFGTHSGSANSTNGAIECGKVTAGGAIKGGTVTVGDKATLQYDSTNECLNFVFA